MPTVNAISEFLDAFAPPDLAEDWDNVGLLVGDRETAVDRLMTCLTVTAASAGEAPASPIFSRSRATCMSIARVRIPSGSTRHKRASNSSRETARPAFPAR